MKRRSKDSIHAGWRVSWITPSSVGIIFSQKGMLGGGGEKRKIEGDRSDEKWRVIWSAQYEYPFKWIKQGIRPVFHEEGGSGATPSPQRPYLLWIIRRAKNARRRCLKNERSDSPAVLIVTNSARGEPLGLSPLYRAINITFCRPSCQSSHCPFQGVRRRTVEQVETFGTGRGDEASSSLILSCWFFTPSAYCAGLTDF